MPEKTVEVSERSQSRLQKKEEKKAWNLDLRFLKGVGPKSAALLEKASLSTLWDLLFYFPRDYEDRSRFLSAQEVLNQIRDSQLLVLKGHIGSFQRKNFRRGRTWMEASFRIASKESEDLPVFITLLWFNDYKGSLERLYPPGAELVIVGKVQNFRGRWQISHPQVYSKPEELPEWEFGSYVGRYSALSKLNSRSFRKIFHHALTRKEFLEIPEIFSQDLLEKLQLSSFVEGIKELHRPRKWDPLTQQRENPFFQRLAFEEFFMMTLAMRAGIHEWKKEYKKKGLKIPQIKKEEAFLLSLEKKLPFDLTQAQKTALEEICMDLKSSDEPMHRLLQGDVGSGKTIVAFLSMRMVAESGFQSALMAPTEILADQHFENFKKLFPELSSQVRLLKGALKVKEKKELRKELEEGKLRFVIGTQALLAEATFFHKLGLVIIDEQHRFGVEQRIGLKKKEEDFYPHLLVMTATPIPRSLALSLYADLKLSQIREKPVGRKPIETRFLGASMREKLKERLRALLEKGQQVYLLYPLVEESEELEDLKDAKTAFKEWSDDLQPYNVGILHGQMKSAEKEKAMQAFKEKKTQALVCTTVVEVGVDVPNATVIVIEHAERFGLSQLHQLRGRVGRGSAQSYCLLMGSARMSREAEERLKVMVESEDGFYIAEKDLELRGPGEFLGRRQSGLPRFRAGHIMRDLDLLEQARAYATEIIGKDPELKLPEHQKIKERMQCWWASSEELTQSG